MEESEIMEKLFRGRTVIFSGKNEVEPSDLALVCVCGRAEHGRILTYPAGVLLGMERLTDRTCAL